MITSILLKTHNEYLKDNPLKKYFFIVCIVASVVPIGEFVFIRILSRILTENVNLFLYAGLAIVVYLFTQASTYAIRILKVDFITKLSNYRFQRTKKKVNNWQYAMLVEYGNIMTFGFQILIYILISFSISSLFGVVLFLILLITSLIQQIFWKSFLSKLSNAGSRFKNDRNSLSQYTLKLRVKTIEISKILVSFGALFAFISLLFIWSSKMIDTKSAILTLFIMRLLIGISSAQSSSFVRYLRSYFNLEPNGILIKEEFND